MIAEQVVAIVPARAGSKGIPGKNLRHIGGRSLLQWTVGLAMSMPEIDRCIVSTDGADIAGAARELGAEVHIRLPELASDTALVVDAVRAVIADCVDDPDNTIGVLLEPTSPLRAAADIRACLDGLTHGFDSAATFTDAALHPHRAFRIEAAIASPFIDGAVPWRPRQQLQPPAYQLTGHVYAFRADRLPAGASLLYGRIHPVVVSADRAIDIDEPHHLELADVLLRRHGFADAQSPATS